MFQRLPYAGTERKLVLAFDIGTTFSGVSYWCAVQHRRSFNLSFSFFFYSILDPGKVPEIKGVTRY